MSRYQKGKTNLYFTEARDSGWQWHNSDNINLLSSEIKCNYNINSTWKLWKGWELNFFMTVLKLELDQESGLSDTASL